MSAFRRRIDKEARYCNINLMQSRVLRLDHVLWGLVVGGYGPVAEDDVSRSQLSVGVDKNF